MTELKKFTRKEIKERDTKTQTVFIIDNVVYDAHAFLDEHPGGHEVLKGAAGTDTTEDFEDVGHSLDAKELMKKFIVGELVDEDRSQSKKKQINWDDAPSTSESGFMSSWKFPLVVGVLMTVLYTYLFG